ncbi:orcokinin peptides isoform X2 [Papilio machaon]|uniref:orcokinin peptides isoform X2 n=1 Tax=Papilio machaon TaxID=76193 RepID=UPI001E6649CD|nr:orcokinin peptides isoform X2 [Papilio machaon]
MMRAGRFAVVITALLVCCNAEPHREQDGSVNEHSSERYDANGHKVRNLDPLGGGNLVREVRESRHSSFLPFSGVRRYEIIANGKRQLFPLISSDYYREDYPKRNFDEIDRSELDSFVGKRNIDDLEQPFPYAAKRFYNLYGSNYLDIPVTNLDKKRYRPDYPMDEIDLSHFPIGSKRSMAFNQNRPLR